MPFFLKKKLGSSNLINRYALQSAIKIKDECSIRNDEELEKHNSRVLK